MEHANGGLEWKHGALWALANVLGWAASITVPVLGIPTDSVSFILGGLLIGLAQWLALSSLFPIAPWWIPAYGLGWGFALWLGLSLGFLVPEPFSMGAAGGASVGVMQWLVLRRRLRRAWVWVPTMVISSMAGCWIGVLAGISANDHGWADSTVLAYVLGAAAAGAVIGVLSGAVLMVLRGADTVHNKGLAVGGAL